MTGKELGTIIDRIEAVLLHGKKFTDLQTEEWLDSFQNEDYSVTIRAFKAMKDGGYGMQAWGFPPTPSVFWNYINAVKAFDEAQQQARQRPKYEPKSQVEKDRDARWWAFIWWLYNQIKYHGKKKLLTQAEVMREKAEWEKQQNG